MPIVLNDVIRWFLGFVFSLSSPKVKGSCWRSEGLISDVHWGCSGPGTVLLLNEWQTGCWGW